MPDAHLIVAARRLASDLRDLGTALHKMYPKPSRQVTSAQAKRRASGLAETWLADLSQRSTLVEVVSSNSLANLNVHFQRLLIIAEHATLRRRYDEEIRAILRDYTNDVVVPLMRHGPSTEKAASSPPTAQQIQASDDHFKPTVFVGHSFAASDIPVVEAMIGVLEAMGMQVVTGRKPAADRISSKVKRLIERQHLFCGIFTCRDRIAGKNLWTTSAWVIDEKAYASGKNKKLILLKEVGVESIGGIQGDYEYIEFARERLHEALTQLMQLFSIETRGLRD